MRSLYLSSDNQVGDKYAGLGNVETAEAHKTSQIIRSSLDILRI